MVGLETPQTSDSLTDTIPQKSLGDSTARNSLRMGPSGKRTDMTMRKMQREIEVLKKENCQLKKKERLFALHQKGFDDANNKVAKLSKELNSRNTQLRSDSLVIDDCERRLQEANAIIAEMKKRESEIHEGYHETFKENASLKQQMRRMRVANSQQSHMRSRSTYTKVASAAGLNVFEHCKRLEQDLPQSSRCLANFQRVLKAIDKHDRELVQALDREQDLLELCTENNEQAKRQLRELLVVHKRIFQCKPCERDLAELAAACKAA